MYLISFVIVRLGEKLLYWNRSQYNNQIII